MFQHIYIITTNHKSFLNGKPCFMYNIYNCLSINMCLSTPAAIDITDCAYSGSHETICTSILRKKDQSKHILFLIRWMKIVWYNTQQSHVFIQPLAVIIIGSPSTRAVGHVWCSWSQVSPVMLLMTSFWHLTMLRYVSWYVSYRDIYIAIWTLGFGHETMVCTECLSIFLWGSISLHVWRWYILKLISVVS